MAFLWQSCASDARFLQRDARARARAREKLPASMMHARSPDHEVTLNPIEFAIQTRPHPEDRVPVLPGWARKVIRMTLFASRSHGYLRPRVLATREELARARRNHPGAR